jgi:hypothetical protein
VAALRDDLAIELAAAQLKLRKRDMGGTPARINSSVPHHRVSTLDSFLDESNFAGTAHVRAATFRVTTFALLAALLAALLLCSSSRIYRVTLLV